MPASVTDDLQVTADIFRISNCQYCHFLPPVRTVPVFFWGGNYLELVWNCFSRGGRVRSSDETVSHVKQIDHDLDHLDPKLSL